MPKSKLTNLIERDGFITLDEGMSVNSALREWRKASSKAKESDFVYVVDKEGKLSGAVSAKDLILEDSSKKLSELVDPEFPVVLETDRTIHAVGVAIETPISEIPVVDKQGRLVGIVSTNVLLDALSWIHARNINNLAGILRSSENVEISPKSVFNSVVSRIPWLLFGVLVGVFVAGGIIKNYESAILMVPAITFFIPVLMGFGGNVGTQTSTVFVRLFSKSGPEVMRIFRRMLFMDLLVGAVLGIVLGGITAVSALILFDNIQLAFVLFISMLAISLFAVFIGVVIPLASHKLKLDPALVSAPVVTAIKDVLALLVYFAILGIVFGM